jgi:Tfp pilus assembly protein PilZ
MPKWSENTRKHKRKKSAFLLKYHEPDANAPKVTNLRNISAGGVAFLTNDQIRIGSEVRLSILIPSFEKPVEVEGSVVRVDNSATKGMKYLVAVQYTKIIGESKKAMEEFDKILSKAPKKSKRTPIFVDLSRWVFGAHKKEKE